MSGAGPAEYAYSLNEEDFEHGGDSPEAALEEASFAVRDRTGDSEHSDYKPGDLASVWIGRCVKTHGGGYVIDCADVIIDRAREAAYDDVGEHTGEWLHNTTKAQDADLSKMIADTFSAWCLKHGLEPDFYSIIETTKHEIVAVGEDDVELDALIAKGQGDSPEADALRERIADAQARVDALMGAKEER